MPFVFAIFIILLSMIPCKDIDLCQDNCEKSCTNTETENYCSPFCNCDCCGTNALWYYVPKLDLKHTLVVKIDNKFPLKITFCTSYFLSIWLPPKNS